MRVLHILDHGLPLHSGYTFRTRAILTAQMARGWQVAAVTGARQGVTQQPRETVDGIDFHRTVPPRALPAPLGELAEIRAFAASIDRVVAQFRPDILHAHSPVLDALAALRVARRRHLPLVYEIRAFWEDAAVGNGTGTEGSARYRATRALESWAVRRADGVAVICEGLRRDLVARGIEPGKIMVSPNGVDLTLFGDPPPPDMALAAELGLAGKEVLGFIGSFYDYEGLDTLIAAMPALVAARPDVRLLLVGGGPMEAALRAQAAASSAAHAIRFIGRVPHQEVERYYGLVDLLVYPRKAMRLTDLVTPLKPLEAMAQRRLVAASDVGGHRELICDGDTGTLFPPDDPAALASRVTALLADRSGWEAMRDRGRAFVEAERNWASNVARYQPLYQRLVAGKRPGPVPADSAMVDA
ncbi:MULTISPECIES: TIGR04063 family PEP-CTERM/XrtA system glycosyltransferase [unclassified Sphingomonas]|uniref:TIGR04063 family PEP-CTERM/XrtA system glycosyltransferase n=1 Tax=unclassified Sphingomonas TaxID=196159 RepID=UPI0006FA5205|nr:MULTISPECIES: TIGR04063 family PEP-CTERM/XrtA system glycosyltransferase [unclassified Sphingomonas]KQM61539.1 glycosyl transferase family 1 [Sphingomonas sp. Leaf16]KQN12635.1 glycosyl transferase family 1 [Sphingomonas sp. Leaf29]KQN19114.1 glycosyl transferase family 1 [Sphingomonas sp. Leaf32]